MTAKRIKKWILALTMLLTIPAAFWAVEPVTALPLVDLIALLPPPPAQDSSQTADEIKEILSYQRNRTDQMVASAQGDQELTVFRFADVLGPAFTPGKLPFTTAFFEKVLRVSEESVGPAKAHWKRLRPYVQNPKIHPCVKMPINDAYPSGHATAGTMMAVLLVQMIPEKREELFMRGWKFALNRVVGGVHYRSDVEAGRIAGTVLAHEILKSPSFKKEFEKARAELRGALGYAIER
jgi:acid phosphatase (class A)